MDGKRFLHSIQLQGLLSFGPASQPIELQPLNVLIGPNGVGKSNLIEAINLLRTMPSDLTAGIREGGGITEMLWKGADANKSAYIQAVLASHPEERFAQEGVNLEHEIVITAQNQRLQVEAEQIENDRPLWGYHNTFFFYRFNFGDAHQPTFSRVDATDNTDAATGQQKNKRRLERGELSPQQSVLAQGRRFPGKYPELAYLADQYERIAIYRNWGIGRNVAARSAQPADLPSDYLLEDGSNLAHVLNELRYREGGERIDDYLKRFNPAIKDLRIRVAQNSVVLYVEEEGLSQPISAARLSDGTIRYLSLLAVLLDPSPHSLICIEEPELGLHPDVMGDVADLLVDAAQRTQLIVTTHSRQLVGNLSQHPEAVAVCSKDENGTKIEHLDAAELDEWLEDYSLGELWSRGFIEGNPR